MHKRYVVEVDPQQAIKLAAEQLALATQVDNGSTRLLIFRDRFVACKIATLSGGTFRQGHIVDGDAPHGGLPFGDRTLLLEPPTVAEAVC